MTTTATGTSATALETSATGGAARGEAGARPSPRTATVNLPFVTATFRRPELQLPQVRVPSMQEVSSAAKAVQSYLPSGRQVVYFGGLAAMTAFQIIEWPVALAIGAGAALMGGSQGHEQQQDTRSRTTGPATKGTVISAEPRPASPGGAPSATSSATPPSS